MLVKRRGRFFSSRRDLKLDSLEEFKIETRNQPGLLATPPKYQGSRCIAAYHYHIYSLHLQSQSQVNNTMLCAFYNIIYCWIFWLSIQKHCLGGVLYQVMKWICRQKKIISKVGSCQDLCCNYHCKYITVWKTVLLLHWTSILFYSAIRHQICYLLHRFQLTLADYSCWPYQCS